MYHNDMIEYLEQIKGDLESGNVDVALEQVARLKDELGDSVDFRKVVDSLIDGVYVTDDKAITRYVNPAYCKHTGIAPDEILGRSVTEIAEEGTLFSKSVSADVISLKHNVTRTGMVRNNTDKSVAAYATGVPIFDEGGTVRNVAVSVFDPDSLLYRVTEFRNTVHIEKAVQIMDNFSEENMNRMLGNDSAVRNIRRTIARAAPTDVTMLITGESGVGKEVVADSIYSASDRKGKPYVKVNCTAIPANLLESELFGYEKGAFTGALHQGKAGLFELANHGTILLDEIGDLPYELQTKLLRVLQQKEVMRIGGKKPISLDVRVIAATNADLKQKIKDGKFREDLYYRLSVVPVYIPPLRERKGDIDKLVKHYFFEYCTKHAHTVTVPDETLELFRRYPWPGNVRELQNVIEYMVICCEGNVLLPQMLADYLGMDSREAGEEKTNLKSAVESYEKELILRAIADCGGVRKAARSLGVDASTISRKARKYGIEVAE